MLNKEILAKIIRQRSVERKDESTYAAHKERGLQRDPWDRRHRRGDQHPIMNVGHRIVDSTIGMSTPNTTWL